MTDLILALDSPLAARLAPELKPFITRVTKLRDETKRASCGACAKRRVAVELLTIQHEMQNLVDSTPALAAIIPQLLASAPKSTP